MKKNNIENITIHELINLVYQVEETQDASLALQTYKIIRKKYLDSFKRVGDFNYEEQKILKQLYETRNINIENINQKKLIKNKKDK